MYERLVKLIPIMISYLLALTLVFMALLSPLIFLGNFNVGVWYMLLFILSVFSVSSAIVGIAVYLVLSPLTVAIRQSKKKR